MPSIPILKPGETPRARAQRHVSALCANGLAKLVLAAVSSEDEPITATLYDRKAGIRLTVRLSKWNGPAYEVAGRNCPAKSPTVLRDVEGNALEAAPKANERPITVRALAKRAGYRDSGHFREAVNQLLERGLLVRIRGGIRRTT